MDYSLVFDLIWKLVTMILRKNAVFESASELGVDLTKYIVPYDEAEATTAPATTQSTDGGSVAAGIVGNFLTNLL